MKFLYYLAAIGEPNFEIKLDILKTNMITIYNNIQQNFDIIVNCYEENCDILKIIQSFNLNFLENILIHNKKGVLSELWLTNEHHSTIENYDYIFFILDDVKILNIDIKNLIFIKLKYNIEFLSPKVLKATWGYMKDNKYKGLMLTNRVEIFCLLFTPENFKKFMIINDINNPNIWGVDYLMSHLNIKTAVFHDNQVEHFLKSKSDHETATKQMYIFLKKHGYSSDKEIKDKYNCEILEIINNNHLLT